MKSFFVADAPRFENEVVTSFFCLSSLSVREKKGAGGQYLVLVLSDKTGQLEARMWEDFADVLQGCNEGCFVKAQGQISRYNGRFQITLTRMRAADGDEVEQADFVPTSRFDIGGMEGELRSYVEAFSDVWLRRLIGQFLNDPEIGPAFRVAPAAKRLHHAWLGGLLEHVLHLVRLCRTIAPLYPEVNADLLIAGAILHDIGKVRELSWRNSFEYTLEGQLIGHISIAQRMLSEKIAELNAEAHRQTPGEHFPDELRLLLEHMLLAHHGKLEFGSPKLPMTPEALLLSALDDLEAKFQTMRGEFASAVAMGRSAQQPTEWVRSMERNLFDSPRYLEQVRSAEAPALTTLQPSSEITPQPSFEPSPQDPTQEPAREPAQEAEMPAFTLRLLE